MGFDNHSVRFLLVAKSNGVSFERIATIGRQAFYLTAHQLQGCFRECGVEISGGDAQRLLTEENGFVEPLLRQLGASEICSIDASTYEGATTIHDMNAPVPENLKRRFSAVIDGGSLEHVFNFPTALKNCMEMVEVGGHFITFSPGNNWFGHGFYQFSPELYFRVFSPANGFELQRIIVCEATPRARWYEVLDPQLVKSRVQLVNFRPTHLLVQAKRTSAVPVFQSPPQQSDYTREWAESLAASTQVLPKSNFRASLGKLTRKLGPFHPKRIRDLGRLIFHGGITPGLFRRVDVGELCARPETRRP